MNDAINKPTLPSERSWLAADSTLSSRFAIGWLRVHVLSIALRRRLFKCSQVTSATNTTFAVYGRNLSISIENVCEDAHRYVSRVTLYIGNAFNRCFPPFLADGHIKAHIHLLFLKPHVRPVRCLEFRPRLE